MSESRAEAPRLSAFIFGSCVSRDLARIDSGRFVVGYYLARQSWISAYSPPRRAPKHDLVSPFQRRMVDGDFGSLGARLLRGGGPSEHDLVLIDLVDERVGVVPYQGSWVTWSGEMRRSGALPATSRRQLVSFGTDQHFDLWRDAAQRAREDLDAVMDRVVVLNARFTDETREGGAVEPSGGDSAAVWNSRYARYYNHLRGLGFLVIEQEAQHSVSTEAHKWGPAPFHYVDEAYRSFGDEITARITP